MKRPMYAITVLSATLLSGMALADISVHVNGTPIQFSDATPKMSGGRVLVPLRAVLEGMSIGVKFEPATSTITATKDSRVVQLTLGRTEAFVNDNLVILDTPAQAVNGRTYIPLRFFGEAFGAEVKWRGYDETVLITTNSGTDTSSNTTPRPGAATLTLDKASSNWVKGGQRISFNLNAAANQNARLYLQGGQIEIPFRETSPGKYTATYTVPTRQVKEVSFADETAYAIIGSGSNRTAVQLNQPVRVDNETPQFVNISFKDNQRLITSRPEISAELQDLNGSGIDKSSLKLIINGKDITGQSYVSDRLVVFKPNRDLDPGAHRISMRVSDKAGNTTMVERSFIVVNAKGLVKDIKVDAPNSPEPGDEINFFATVAKDVKNVWVKLGHEDEPMFLKKSADNRYIGQYTVSKADSFDDTPVILIVEDVTGQKLEYQSDQKLTMGNTTTPAPELLNPKPNVSAGDSITITGAAARAAKVRIKIEYVDSILGLLESRGVVMEKMYDVDEKGIFDTGKIQLSGILGSKPDKYVITVTSISRTGKESKTITRTIRG